MKFDQSFADVLPTTGFSNGNKYFAGWYAGNELVDTEKYSDLKPSSLTAKWVNTFTVRFYDAKGFVISTQNIKSGENAIPPSSPAKAQDNEYTYSFKAWD